jgi:putative membrane protein
MVRHFRAGRAAFALALVAVACWASAAPPAGRVFASESRPSTPAQRLERQFLRRAATDLRFRSEASRLAQDRSNNPQVRELAEALLAYEQTAQPQLLRLLDARGMAMPMRDGGQDKVLRRLARLQGAQFDRLYVDEVVLRSIQADIAGCEQAAQEAEDPVLKAWAGQELPALRQGFERAGQALPNAGLRGRGAV